MLVKSEDSDMLDWYVLLAPSTGRSTYASAVPRTGSNRNRRDQVPLARDCCPPTGSWSNCERLRRLLSLLRPNHSLLKLPRILCWEGYSDYAPIVVDFCGRARSLAPDAQMSFHSERGILIGSSGCSYVRKRHYNQPNTYCTSGYKNMKGS